MFSTIIPLEAPTGILIQQHISLADKNWFGTGGSARFFAEPATPEAFAFCLNFARERQLDLFILGQGANILVSDEGYDGLVIRPAFRSIEHTIAEKNEALVTAGSGVTMHDLIEYCLQHQIVGLEEFSGIPGTIGGSVYINLHYFEFLLSQFMISATIIQKSTGITTEVGADWFAFGYNSSTLQDETYYLLDATFRLKQCSPLEAAYARGRSVEITRHRVKRYPHKGTCGSFFRNFHEDEVSLTSNGKKMIYVAYYLDKLGLKGTLSVGDAIVSYQHANMLVNKGNASSQDIINLARTMQEVVLKEYGIIPQPECRFIGFKKYPLL